MPHQQQHQQQLVQQGGGAAVAQHAPPVVRGFVPRCEWELDPRKVLVGRRLAVGGFAEVFLGKYEGTVVAIKRLLTNDAATIERFVSEVRMLARLRHPNLILFMGYCTTPELCIISEYMSKGSLYSQRQRRLEVLDPKIQRLVAVAVARGMAYLHTRTPPILHLDLKSPNILVDERWRVKITDFGLSRARQQTYVSASAQGGTPEWMAPEVLRCESVAEPADVYSYGVVLWELITGRAPWENYNPMQVVAMVGFRELQLPLPTAAAEPFLLDLCRRCVHRDPAARPSFTQI
ncbi:kinase-like domain-containing protein, partial [Scenedesmus sp. NREL 46B-D3]